MVLTEARARVAALGWNAEGQPREEVATCNLCGGRTFVTVTHEDRYGYPFPAAACSRCGLVCLNPCPTAAAYDSFYRETYRPLVSAYHGRVIDAKSVEAEQAVYAKAVEGLLAP